MSDKQSIAQQIIDLGKIVDALSHKASFKDKAARLKKRRNQQKFIAPAPDDSASTPRSDQYYPT